MITNQKLIINGDVERGFQYRYAPRGIRGIGGERAVLGNHPEQIRLLHVRPFL